MAGTFLSTSNLTAVCACYLSFRCDKITISPQLLSELQSSSDPLPRKLSPDMKHSPDSKVDRFSADVFTSLHGSDQMAVDKLKQVRHPCACIGPASALTTNNLEALSDISTLLKQQHKRTASTTTLAGLSMTHVGCSPTHQCKAWTYWVRSKWLVRVKLHCC